MALPKKILKRERNYFNDAHHIAQSLRERPAGAPCYVRWAPRGLHAQQWDDVAPATNHLDERICVITASTGVGKTTVAIMIALMKAQLCFIVTPCMTQTEIKQVTDAMNRRDVLIVDDYDADPKWGARMCAKHGKIIVTQTMPKFTSSHRAYTSVVLRPLPVQFVHDTLRAQHATDMKFQQLRNIHTAVRGDFRRICHLVEERSRVAAINHRRGLRTVDERAQIAVDCRKRLDARIACMDPEVCNYCTHNFYPQQFGDAVRWTETVSSIDVGAPPEMLCAFGAPVNLFKRKRCRETTFHDYVGEPGARGDTGCGNRNTVCVSTGLNGGSMSPDPKIASSPPCGSASEIR